MPVSRVAVHTKAKARHLPLKCRISGDDDNSLTGSRSIRAREWGRCGVGGGGGGSKAAGAGEGNSGERGKPDKLEWAASC